MSNRFLVALLLVSAPFVSEASDLNAYVGGAVGQGVEIEAIEDVGADGSDACFTLFGGLGIGEHLAAEISYHDYGTTSCCGPGYADLGFVRSGDGFSASALALWPIHRFRLYARAGFLWWDVDGSDLTVAGRQPYSDNGVDLIVGLGGDISVMKRLRVRLEWEHVEIDGDDADSVSIGALWQF
jgi:opacity protein-like surface antigen